MDFSFFPVLDFGVQFCILCLRKFVTGSHSVLIERIKWRRFSEHVTEATSDRPIGPETPVLYKLKIAADDVTMILVIALVAVQRGRLIQGRTR